MSQACMARKIQAKIGTQAAARFLMYQGWPLYLALFCLTGRFPRED